MISEFFKYEHRLHNVASNFIYRNSIKIYISQVHLHTPVIHSNLGRDPGCDL